MATVDRCICCGEIIPEGRQACPNCLVATKRQATKIKRLIDANALLAEYDRVHIGPPGRARKLIADSPTVDAVEVVHGRWKKHEETGFMGCSRCWDVFVEEEWLTDGRWNYCPGCGAKMDLPNITDQTIDALLAIERNAHGGNAGG